MTSNTSFLFKSDRLKKKLDYSVILENEANLAGDVEIQVLADVLAYEEETRF